jgi:D-alanyl-D-alanine carboxypeptidase/D-alanyl-D-alanine-endopeptidase (penicillin-binding protein 4)
LANLGEEIEKIINRPEWERSRWGILVETLNTEQVLYDYNAQSYFIPASNAKILTTAAALRQLGRDFRLRTSVYASGNLPNLTTLKIVGRGDPTLTDAKLKTIAQQLKQMGVRHISELIVEDAYFSSSKIDSTWEWEDIYGDWGVAVNSLILNQNTATIIFTPEEINQPVKIQWLDPVAATQWRIDNYAVTSAKGTENTIKIEGIFAQPGLKITGQLPQDTLTDVWRIPVAEPADYFLESFWRILLASGISVTRGSVSHTSAINPEEKEILYLESPTLAELIYQTNQESNNLMAEIFFKLIGQEGLEKNLTELGVDREGYVLEDGSGLSRHNLLSPEAIVQTLSAIAKTTDADIYRSSLPLAGVSGSLKNRLKNTIVQGKLQAKTGGMTGVYSLSGYLEVTNYQPLIFSIILNQDKQPFSQRVQAIDQLILLLASLKDCQK